MRKKALQVTLEVVEPSVVELTVGDRVRLDRLARAEHGYVAERRGDVLAPGRATLPLEPGYYFFRTLSDASLRVVSGGVNTAVGSRGKDPPVPPPPKGVPPDPVVGGDEPPGDAPSFTLE